MTKDEFLIWLSAMPEDATFDIGEIVSVDTSPALIQGTIEFSFDKN